MQSMMIYGPILKYIVYVFAFKVLGFKNSASLIRKEPQQFHLLGLSQFLLPIYPYTKV